MALLPDLGTEIVIPLCAVIGIVFSLVQWFLVSKVKLSPERGGASAANNGKNGYSEYLIEEEDGINDQTVVVKCAEIQNAISEGQNSSRSHYKSADLIFHLICVCSCL
ncbi:UNVERIFIED_CONTAM: Pyrophosphate-energized vacuolar membrane proton pump 1 [Sesamum radiatum]|uniref:H(+)-exporting diphosphatase n=1 Tax=Sesamum radiatum TaxID=300843 RepID=A0AAW2PG06_SESRA